MTATSRLDDEIVHGLLGFVDKFVVPLEAEHAEVLENPRLTYDERGGYAPDALDSMRAVRQEAAAAGYYQLFAPESVGGAGLGAVTLFRAWEALYHHCGPGRLLPYQVIGHWSSGPSFLLDLLSPEARELVLDPFMDGSQTFCFALSEPDAGSDAWALTTRAVRDGDGWVLNGTKQWISNSPFARYAFVFAETDGALRRERKGGVTCFLVPTDAPGFAVDSVLKLFGSVGGNESILSLTDVRVPDWAVVGELGRGFATALAGVSLGRMYNAGRCCGLARWALERAVGYAQQRSSFGATIGSYQGVSFPLAESAMEIYGARTMSLDCAARIDAGRRAVVELAMVKATTTEMCFRVYDRSIQVHGGMGMTNEMRLYDGWHLARLLRIADGSGEIMRRTIAGALFADKVDFEW